MNARIINWLANGRVGASSRTMALTALGAKCQQPAYPLDPADFNRCLLLVRTAPEVRRSFPTIRALSPEWAALIDHWDELESLFIDEVGWDWSKYGTAGRTYDRMQQLYQTARAEAGGLV